MYRDASTLCTETIYDAWMSCIALSWIGTFREDNAITVENQVSEPHRWHS